MTALLTDGDALLRAIATNPADVAAWNAYADWLDEHGQPEAAESARENRVYVGPMEEAAAGWLKRLHIGLDASLYGAFFRMWTQVKVGDWRRLWQKVWQHRKYADLTHIDRGISALDLVAHARRVLAVVEGP